MKHRCGTFLFVITLLAFASPARADAEKDCRSQISARVVPACTELLKGASLTTVRRIVYLELRSWAHTDLKAFEAAEADVNEIFKLEPNSHIGYGARGRLRHFLGNNDLALNDYNQSVALAKNKYTPTLNRGLFFVRTLNFDAARVDYEAAMQLDPKKAAPYVGRAKVHRHFNRDDDALKDLDTAATAEPEHAPTYLDRGELLLALKLPRRALADFEKALTILPTSTRATRGRDSARAMLNTDGSSGGNASSTAPAAPQPAAAAGQTPQAAKPAVAQPVPPPTAPPGPAAKPPAAATPTQPAAKPQPAATAAISATEALLAQALDLRKKDKEREAIAIYDKIIASEPENFAALLGRSNAYEDLNEYRPAFQGYEALEKGKAPPAVRARALEGLTRIGVYVGDPDFALVKATEALKLDPSLEARYWRGVAFVRVHRYAAAISDLGVIKESPHGRAAAWEAYAHVANGDHAAAAPKIEAAFKQNDRLAINFVSRLRLALAKGDLAGAEKDLGMLPPNSPIPEVKVAQQLVMLHKLLKPTDAPLTAKRN